MKKVSYLFVIGMALAIIGSSLLIGFKKIDVGMTIWTVGGALILLSIIFDYKAKVLFWT